MRACCVCVCLRTRGAGGVLGRSGPCKVFTQHAHLRTTLLPHRPSRISSDRARCQRPCPCTCSSPSRALQQAAPAAQRSPGSRARQQQQGTRPPLQRCSSSCQVRVRVRVWVCVFGACTCRGEGPGTCTTAIRATWLGATSHAHNNPLTSNSHCRFDVTHHPPPHARCAAAYANLGSQLDVDALEASARLAAGSSSSRRRAADADAAAAGGGSSRKRDADDDAGAVGADGQPAKVRVDARACVCVCCVCVWARASVAGGKRAARLARLLRAQHTADAQHATQPRSGPRASGATPRGAAPHTCSRPSHTPSTRAAHAPLTRSATEARQAQAQAALSQGLRPLQAQRRAAAARPRALAAKVAAQRRQEKGQAAPRQDGEAVVVVRWLLVRGLGEGGACVCVCVSVGPGSWLFRTRMSGPC